MRVPIIMPQLGESIAEATIISIAISEGDHVSVDQEIIEVETNKALMQVTTPCAGHVGELIAEAQQTYVVGAILGYIEATAEESARIGQRPEKAAPAPMANGSEKPAPVDLPLPETMPVDTAPKGSEPRPIVAGSGWAIPAGLAGANYLSPRLKARLAELHLQPADMAGVVGTGARRPSLQPGPGKIRHDPRNGPAHPRVRDADRGCRRDAPELDAPPWRPLAGQWRSTRSWRIARNVASQDRAWLFTWCGRLPWRWRMTARPRPA